MRFKDSLWDESDPAYAPCITKSKSYLYWKAPKKYVDLGCTVTRQRLTGTAGDGQDMLRAAECRALTRDMLAEFSVDTPQVDPATWRYLFHRYRMDAESPYQSVKANTRDNYDMLLTAWENAIGNAYRAQADYRAAVRWQNAMRENGRSPDWIHRMFTMLRSVVRYGALIEDKEAVRFKAILSDMRITVAKPRKTEGTPEQIAAVIAEAEADGAHSLALGWTMQWWWSLRPVDIRGQWLKTRPGEDHSGIVRNGRRWQDGMTWDMIDPEITRLTKMISKTSKTTAVTKTFNLMQVPEIRDRLLRVPPEKRVGPVILNKDGLPYTHSGWAHAWVKYRRKAGLPEHVKNMGIRAASLTDGERAGASPFQLRDAAGHSDIATTNRYIRGADEAVENVINLRRGERK